MTAITSIQEKYMKEALRQAKKAAKLGEVPIGCVIVHEGRIIGRGYNRRNTDKNTLSHAEITAIRRASKVIGDWRLEECTLYVTLEPCQMCAGAIVQSRMKKLVIGARSIKSGSCGSIINILDNNEFNHKVQVEYLKNEKPSMALYAYQGLTGNTIEKHFCFYSSNDTNIEICTYRIGC